MNTRRYRAACAVVRYRLCFFAISGIMGHDRPLANNRPSPKCAKRGVRGLLVYCADYRCSHSIAINSDLWLDDLRLFDIEPRFVCRACGKRGADVRPDFNWNRQPRVVMGYR